MEFIAMIRKKKTHFQKVKILALKKTNSCALKYSDNLMSTSNLFATTENEGMFIKSMCMYTHVGAYLLNSKCCFFLLKFDLFICTWKAETYRLTERWRASHPMVHFPKCPQEPGWPRLKPGTENCTQVFTQKQGSKHLHQDRYLPSCAIVGRWIPK